MRISLSFQFTHITTAILLLALFLPGVQASDLTEGLNVDFTNRESRSISLRLGSADGISAQMNFAVIDSAGIQIAEFFPQEILMDRFWSGPFDQEKFARIRIGDPVVTIKLDPEEAAQLRKQFQGRTVELREKRRKRRLELMEDEKVDLKEQINELDVESVGLAKDLQSLQEKIKREKNLTKRRVDDLQEQIDELRDERTELSSERQELLDKRDSLLRKSNPPQDRIGDVNADISDLDRAIGVFNLEINDLREDIRDLREESRDLEGEINELRDEQRELELEKKELNMELNELEKELMELQQKK
ncbi:MAG: hypothetical protein RRA15_08330 [bacterium]|nr:hypothetical protein [bacterium]MDT8366486.1 hypothetical protein [bacterium]